MTREEMVRLCDEADEWHRGQALTMAAGARYEVLIEKLLAALRECIAKLDEYEVREESAVFNESDDVVSPYPTREQVYYAIFNGVSKVDAPSREWYASVRGALGLEVQK